MATINTTNWLRNNELFSQNNADLTSFATNITNGWTLARSASPIESPNFKYFRTGMPIANISSWHLYGNGESVRPPQHITWTGVQGQHIHMTPVINGIRVYRDESGESPTGVLGINMTHWAQSTTSNYAFPNFNDAEYELDLYIYFPSNDANYIRILNYPINTLGFGSTIVLSGITYNVLRRNGIGNGRIQQQQITHNVAQNLQSYQGGTSEGNPFNVNTLYEHNSDIVIAYRIHSAATPYQISHNVPFNQELVNSGIYTYNEPEAHSIDVSGQNIRLLDNLVFQHVPHTTAHTLQVLGNIYMRPGTINLSVQGAIELRTALERITLGLNHYRPTDIAVVGHRVAINDGLVRIRDGGVQINDDSEIRITNASVNLEDGLVYEINGEQFRDNESISDRVGRGFVPVVVKMLWSRLGLR